MQVFLLQYPLLGSCRYPSQARLYGSIRENTLRSSTTKTFRELVSRGIVSLYRVPQKKRVVLALGKDISVKGRIALLFSWWEKPGPEKSVDFHEEPTLATSHQTDKKETGTSPAKPGSELCKPSLPLQWRSSKYDSCSIPLCTRLRTFWMRNEIHQCMWSSSSFLKQKRQGRSFLLDLIHTWEEMGGFSLAKLRIQRQRK